MNGHTEIVRWFEEGDTLFVKTEHDSLERWVIKNHVPIRAEELAE